MKMIPLEKQSKREQRKFHADKRSSWNGIKPTTRIVESRKVYLPLEMTTIKKEHKCVSEKPVYAGFLFFSDEPKKAHALSYPNSRR